MRVTVAINSENLLNREEFIFTWADWLGFGTFILDEYRKQERPTKRHNYTNTKFYRRIDNRNNTVKLHEIVINQEIIDGAKKMFIDQIEFRPT